MPDPRITRLARLLVDYSTRIGPGDKVLIEAEPVAEPMVRAVFERVLEVGGHPHLLLSLGGFASLSGIDDLFLSKAGQAQLDLAPTFYHLAYNEFASRIRIGSSSNTKALTGADQARSVRRQRAIHPILAAQLQRGARGEFRWMSTLFPTSAYAQDAEMSLEEYQRFFYGACHVADDDGDPVAYWNSVQAEQARIVEALEGHDKVHLRGPNCDLRLSIKGRKFLNACGEHNMPDGEVYTGPVEESVEGWVRFTYPAVYQGREVAGVQLKFAAGQVSEATAEKNQAYLEEMLGSDAGARYLGEFAIGTNFGIQRFTRNILLDEKIGGSFHLALGSGYPETGSKNVSAIHWDFICDLHGEAEIAVDGEVIYKDGAFCI
ncbi:MAG TPA: aminopeptidase [Anaerolineales bacterium]|nr:aminopeptidase [Anaerolineales bacterium]